MRDSRPIGVFDSGIGGLTVLRVLAGRFPHESFLYLGDTARLPYGSKSAQTIRKYSEQNIRYLLRQGVKAVVIACNSASSQFHDTEFEGVHVYNTIGPGSKKALAVTQNKKIGVLGTRATIQSGAYASELISLDSQVEVFSQPCPLFVPLAEEGWSQDPITNLVVYRYVSPVIARGVDTLILGCTHYPILREAIEKVTGANVILVDSGDAIADQMINDIPKGLFHMSTEDAKQSIRILTTDSSEHFIQLATKILNPLPVQDFQVVDI